MQNLLHPDWLIPDWPAPPHIRALMTTRAGGVSRGPFESMNVGLRSGDAIENVLRNRDRLKEITGRDIRWLRQVHSATVVEAEASHAEDPPADAAITCGADLALAAMAADCLPVLFCAKDGSAIAAAHAGWRGLSAGILENTLAAMPAASKPIMAWMGACIGPQAFEVGVDVYDAFCVQHPQAETAFTPRENHPGKYWCDLTALARQRMIAAGIAPADIYGGGHCTYSAPERFFSYRRVPESGRMVALIWKTSVWNNS